MHLPWIVLGTMSQDALKYEVDESRALVLVTGRGVLTMPEMVQTFDSIAEASLFRPEFHVIFDLRDASYTAELRDGEDFVAALKRRMDDFRGGVSLVVPESLHGLARLYAILAKVGGYDRMASFLDMDEALKRGGLE